LLKQTIVVVGATANRVSGIFEESARRHHRLRRLCRKGAAPKYPSDVVRDRLPVRQCRRSILRKNTTLV
jgi:hypothetical protein